jgi:D-proline reductase (dithiol) PrdB
LISSAGLYIGDIQTPFDEGNPLGDPTFREIPGDTDLTSLAIAHDHYDHSLGDEDPNVGSARLLAALDRMA